MKRETRLPLGIERRCQQCGAPWLQTDGKAPRDYCTTSCRQEAAGQRLSVAPDNLPLPSHVRVVRARVITITCHWCQEQVALEQFPGPVPRYCSPLCRQAAASAAAAGRMQRMRERRRTSQGRGTPETAQA